MATTEVSAQELGQAILLDEQGKPVNVSSLWENRTAVLVFVRHFG